MLEYRKETNTKTDRRISRGDVYLAVFFLLLALVSFGWFAVNRKEGQTLQISYDGQTLTSMSLSQMQIQKTSKASDVGVQYCLILYRAEGVSCEWYDSVPDLVSTVPDGISYNLLTVSESGVSMEAADCPDRICVHHIPIKGGGESIICLPHKLVVEILGGTETETLDGMVKAEGVSKNVWKEGRLVHETDS